MDKGLELLGGGVATRKQVDPMTLQDGSSVAVIGAGPAGSMFSYFFLNMAEMMGMDVSVDIYLSLIHI
mgnify:FL=1